jgi:hypothetical protein
MSTGKGHKYEQYLTFFAIKVQHGGMKWKKMTKNRAYGFDHTPGLGLSLRK